MNSVMDSSIENNVPPREEAANNSGGKMVPIKSHVQEYIDNSTLHGITHAFRGDTKLRRVIWFMLFITCFGFCFYNISSLLIRYLSRETATRNRVFSPEQLVFPAVTICNYNTFLKSKISTHKQKSGEEKIPEDGFKAAKENTTDFLNDFGHQMDEDGMLLECKWNGMNCSSKNFTSITDDANMGLCHTFNSGRPDYPLLSVSSPGESGGLKLTLNVQTYEYVETTDDIGLKVRVHDQIEPAVMNDLGFAVIPGRKALVSIKRKQHISLPAPFETNCKRNSGKNKYSKAACLNTCKNDYISRICGCRMSPKENLHLPVCSYNLFEDCYLKAQAQFQVMSKQNCSCREACNRTTFETNLSYILFKSIPNRTTFTNIFNETIANQGGTLNDFIRENVVKLSIFYRELSYEQIEDIEAYEFLSFFAEAGGTCGVYLGASLLTAMEIVELIFRLCLNKKKL